MLVLISDLHLTDGSSGSTIHPGAFQIFGDRLCEMAERASWRGDGRYQPIDGIELVLARSHRDSHQHRRRHPRAQ